MEEERPPKLSWGEIRIMSPIVWRKTWQESAFLEGTKDGPPHSWRNVLSTLYIERVEENALHYESSPALLSNESWNLLPHFLEKESRRIFPIILWEDLKKFLPTPLPTEESSSFCGCNMPRKVLLIFVAKGMEVRHDQYGPRSSPQEMHLKRPKPTKNTVKMGVLQRSTLLVKL